MLQCSSV